MVRVNLAPRLSQRMNSLRISSFSSSKITRRPPVLRVMAWDSCTAVSVFSAPAFSISNAPPPSFWMTPDTFLPFRLSAGTLAIFAPLMRRCFCRAFTISAANVVLPLPLSPVITILPSRESSLRSFRIRSSSRRAASCWFMPRTDVKYANSFFCSSESWPEGRVATVSSRSFSRSSSMGETDSASTGSGSVSSVSVMGASAIVLVCSFFVSASDGASRISRISCGSFTVSTDPSDFSSVSASDGASRISRISCGSFSVSTGFSGSAFSTTVTSGFGSAAAFASGTVCRGAALRSMGSTCTL